MSAFLDALLLRTGYNAALVSVGAMLLGLAAGAAGTFMVLRKRALVADAMAHATLPGVALAFLAMVGLGGEGRALWGLMVGAAGTALLGLLAVDRLTARTRLPEDAAIGAVLSVTFGAGVVLLTVIQTMSAGQQAGLEGFLLGSTAGMLRADALTIAAGGLVAGAVIWVLRRPMTIVAFDEGFATATGIDVVRVDRIGMILVLFVTVAGLRIVGIVLVVALLIIPAVAARFWTDRTSVMFWVAALIGGLSGWLGTALSAAAPGLPAGPLVVLVAATIFALSLFLAPRRGVVARAVAARSSSGRLDPSEAARWIALRHMEPTSPLIDEDDGRTPLSALLPPDRLAALDRGPV
ncbi:metal ABC transporter permease [Rubellimicrobium rubrum]|uniref:Metal ABC transporter permease n=1 Tax=Rubellimicrobium rubrum TaxID=2585369 RepID=A0A5C4MR04_9RHOB|nr:metal ABC transporter permease [Rubellimicrobium rubrum]TNC47982.1 metal ABC transporter permease [Rubellimicrobium rubrum]